MASLPAERVAEVVRVELARQGRTQAQLARYVFGDYDLAIANRISRRLRGVIRFTPDELDRVGDFLGIPIELLLDAAA